MYDKLVCYYVINMNSAAVDWRSDLNFPITIIKNIKGLIMRMTMVWTITIMMMSMLLQVGPGDNYTLTVRGFNDALSTLGDSMTQYGSSFSGGEVHNQV